MTPRRQPRARTVLHAEDIDAAISELLEFGRARGKLLRTAREEQGAQGQGQGERPNIEHLLAEEMREALEDEIVPAVETEPNSGIVQWELDRELIKKALVGLKLPALRNIASNQSLEPSGTSEDLAARIAAVYRWDEEEIARLVLENEPEPTAERGHVDRIFPLAEAPTLADVEQRLNYVAGRYIRVGVARWFVFDDAAITDKTITVTGTVRAYQASVDTLSNEPSLSAIASEASAEVVLRHDQSLLVVRRCSASVARAAVKALRTAVRLQPDGLRYRNQGLKGSAMSFAPPSLFILDVLANRLRDAGFGTPNLTVARFKVGDTTEDPNEGDVAKRRPTLRAVRFEGDHLLDSAPACKLLAEEGRALVDVAMHIDVPSEAGDASASYPTRLAIDADHILVMTGFGTQRPELSVGLQRFLVMAATDELQDGFADVERLKRLCDRILKRAQAGAPVAQADMLSEGPSGNEPTI